MDFFDVISCRRSVRSFRADPVPDEIIEKCLEASRLAPSASNSQPWKFLVIKKPELRSILADAGYGQPCLRTAPVITVLFGDRSIYKKRLRRAKELLDIGAITPDTQQAVENKYQKKDGARGDPRAEILSNCMIAGEHFVLAAAALGLGSCWVMLFSVEDVIEACAVTDDYFPVALIPMGWSDQDIAPRPRYSLSEIAWREGVGKGWA